ncbi:hypothetical protein FGIG_08954 [Fasciola gigantica]|uniref:Uncharacterized protein n=1 Tax=Fasciola gigantica TaxID=46835 RepID=A0A504YKZ3_FASGI|nr:hypothetical protein FGIG_08954 [Fasciola gigantica]
MTDVNVLLSFKELAEDDVNCQVLLKDEISLQGLVLLLSNEDLSVVSTVLEIGVELVRERLLQVRGVVSVTFQLAKRRAIVCVVPDLDPTVLVAAVRSVEQADSARKDSAHCWPEAPIQARIVRKRSQLTRNDSLRRSKNRLYPRRADQTCPSEMPAYLDADADLFEVDETRAAPKLKADVYWGKEGGTNGPVDWLSSLLERSFFW